AGGHLERAGDDRLEAGAATPVELHARYVDPERGVECGDAADGRSLTARRALPQHDVVDVGSGQAGPLDEGGEQVGGEGVRVQVAEHPAESPDRGAEGLADDDVTHGVPSFGF